MTRQAPWGVKIDAVGIHTQPFRISRNRLAFLAMEEYLRSFWWYVAIVPIFGLAAVITSEGLLRAIGAMALLWPFSIPARSIVTTAKSGRFFRDEVWMSTGDDALYFHSETSKGMMLRLSSVRDLVRRGDYLLVRLRRLGFVAIPAAAFESDADRTAFERLIAEAPQRRESELSGS